MNYQSKAGLKEKPRNHSGSIGSPAKGRYKKQREA
jgi:hypothetical protein